MPAPLPKKELENLRDRLKVSHAPVEHCQLGAVEHCQLGVIAVLVFCLHNVDLSLP